MKDKIQAAFDGIRADEALKTGTAAYLTGESRPRKRANNRLTFAGHAGAFAAVAATVLLAVIFSYRIYFMPDSYVSIDVNPSVELTLNKLDKVIATYAFNEDGKRILSGINLRGQRYDTAAELIMARIEADGYFSRDSLVSVTVQAANGDKERQLCTSLQQTIDDSVLTKAAALEVFPVSAEIRSHAHGFNVSPAKYLAIQELMEVDEEADIEGYGDSTIPMIRQRIHECRGGNMMAANAQAGEADSSQGNMMNGHMHGRGHRRHG